MEFGQNLSRSHGSQKLLLLGWSHWEAVFNVQAMVVHAPHEEAFKTQQLFNIAKKIKVHIEDHTIKLPKQLAGREPHILRLQLCVEPCL